MNLEDKIRNLPFRGPRPGLREEIIRNCAKTPRVNSFAWRDLWWPSPAAWYALGMVWLIALALFLRPGTTNTASFPTKGRMTAGTGHVPISLLASDDREAALRDLEQQLPPP